MQQSRRGRQVIQRGLLSAAESAPCSRHSHQRASLAPRPLNLSKSCPALPPPLSRPSPPSRPPGALARHLSHPVPRRADEAPGVSRGVRPDPSSSIRLARRSLGSRSRVAVKLAPRVAKISAPRARAPRAGRMAMADGKKKILRENEKEAWLSEMEREVPTLSRTPWRWWRSAASPFPSSSSPLRARWATSASERRERLNL